jgi:hypothetical protein
VFDYARTPSTGQYKLILASHPIAAELASALRRRNVAVVMELRVLFIALGRIA